MSSGFSCLKPMAIKVCIAEAGKRCADSCVVKLILARHRRHRVAIQRKLTGLQSRDETEQVKWTVGQGQASKTMTALMWPPSSEQNFRVYRPISYYGRQILQA